MRHFPTIALLAVGIIHLLSLIAIAGSQALNRLYGAAVEPNLLS